MTVHYHVEVDVIYMSDGENFFLNSKSGVQFFNYPGVFRFRFFFAMTATEIKKGKEGSTRDVGKVRDCPPLPMF